MRQQKLALCIGEQIVAGVVQHLDETPPAADAGKPPRQPRGALGAQGPIGVKRLGHADIGLRRAAGPGALEGLGEGPRVLAVQLGVVVHVARRSGEHIAPESQDEPVQMRQQRRLSRKGPDPAADLDPL